MLYDAYAIVLSAVCLRLRICVYPRLRKRPATRTVAAGSLFRPWDCNHPRGHAFAYARQSERTARRIIVARSNRRVDVRLPAFEPGIVIAPAFWNGNYAKCKVFRYAAAYRQCAFGFVTAHWACRTLPVHHL